VELQRKDLGEIFTTRHGIAVELRRFLNGQIADHDKVIRLSRRYGELDGEMSYFYAQAFAKVGQSLTQQQRFVLNSMRKVDPNEPKGPFLYSSPVLNPMIDGVEKFFSSRS
jgi:hypothetical protein